MNRKQFFIKVLIFIAPIAMMLGILSGIYLPSDPQGYMAAWIDKNTLIKETPSPRILLVGGSNLTFGIDSKTLSTVSGLPVVNTSLHAGVGLDVTLNNVKQYIREGDIILLVPEYEYFGISDGHTRGGVPTLAALLDAYPPAFFQFGPLQLDRLPDILSAVIKMRFDRYKAMRTVDFDLNRYDREIRGPVYSRDQFNQYGDEIGHLNITENPFPLNQLHYLGARIGNGRVIQLLKDFGEFANQRGARIIYLFPYGRKYNCDLSLDGLQKLYPFVVDHFQFTTVSTPLNNCVYDELFFDTNYHLTKTGRELRSVRMVEELRQVLSNENTLPPVNREFYQPLKIDDPNADWSACLEKTSILECANNNLGNNAIQFTPYGESSPENFTTQVLYHLSDDQIAIVATHTGAEPNQTPTNEYRFDFIYENGHWKLEWAGTRSR